MCALILLLYFILLKSTKLMATFGIIRRPQSLNMKVINSCKYCIKCFFCIYNESGVMDKIRQNIKNWVDGRIN